MRWPSARLSLCLAALLSLPLALQSVARAAEAREETDRFAHELARRIQGKAPLEDVRVDVRWPIVDHYASSRLYGRGVLICDGKAQLAVSRDAVVSVLKDLRAARFSAMEDRYGTEGEEEEGEREERKPEERKPEERKPDEGPALKGFVEVRLGSVAKTVQQFAVGDQSKELDALARKLLSVCREAASKATPIGASSLDDGLSKVASGSLAPETFALILNRRAESKVGDAGESFILEIQGRRVTDRPMPPGQKPPAPRSLLVPAADFTSLVRLLADQHIEEIPLNVYADRYTDLRVTVLDRERSILARKFLNTTAQTHGEKQQAFDRAYNALHALHARVAKEGKAVAPDASAPAGEKEREREKEKEKESGKEKD
jgi:hypothetical protein